MSSHSATRVWPHFSCGQVKASDFTNSTKSTPCLPECLSASYTEAAYTNSVRLHRLMTNKREGKKEHENSEKCFPGAARCSAASPEAALASVLHGPSPPSGSCRHLLCITLFQLAFWTGFPLLALAFLYGQAVQHQPGHVPQTDRFVAP